MAVNSVFDIKSFKDIKFWVEQSVYIKIYRNPKTFFKISFPPVCQQTLLHINVLPYFTHCMEVASWHKGGGDVPQPKKCLFLPNKKLMTVMKFSRLLCILC